MEIKSQKQDKHKKDKHRKDRHKDQRRSRSRSRSRSSDESKNDSASEETKRLKLMTEIEKVRKRRLDRENELAEIERLRDEEQRLKELAAFGDWQRKEEEFHLEQAVERSKIRLMEFREHPIDYLVKNILLIETAKMLLETKDLSKKVHTDEYNRHLILLGLEVELKSPSDVINFLSEQELDELQFDLQCFTQLYEKKGVVETKRYWESLLAIVNAKKKKEGSYSAVQLHQSIVADVEDLLRGKTVDELNALEADIRSNLAPGKTLDLEYWELMLQEVLLQRAKADSQAYHLKCLKQLLDLLSQLKAAGISLEEPKAQERSHKPQKGASSSDDPTADVMALEQYLREMADDVDLEDSEMKMIASDEIALPTSTYLWEDKYRPRKPRYFNRVKTGWDRNKYNLTHYDSDNPPPKVIQGYKFTIFYPDLIDKTQAPKYFLEPCPDAENNEFVIIRFHAGPPYEDVAFKILNKEWDRHKRSGFVSMFDRGILQLNFNFKRAFYRR